MSNNVSGGEIYWEKSGRKLLMFFALCSSLCAVSVALEVKSIDVTTKQNQIVNMGKLIAIEKETIEDTITMALQPLNAAKLRLINLDRSELTDMLETDTPPEPIEIVGECFVILKGIRDVTWKTARSIMADENFFKSLMEMNCDVITLKQLSQCKNHIKVSDGEPRDEPAGPFPFQLPVRTFSFCSVENGLQRIGKSLNDIQRNV